MTAASNADPRELAKFAALAQSWWDPKGPSRPLHDLNPLRLGYIASRVQIAGSRALDVGCGGGILSEALARSGATVLGIDLAPAVLEVAELHALETAAKVEYRCVAAETLAAECPAQFPLITCMELLEHVPDPLATVRALANLATPGGDVIVSTLNRNVKSFAVAIIGAEYLARVLPRGTHEYMKFIRPSELARMGREAGLELKDLTGLTYNPLTRAFSLSENTEVNYLAHFKRLDRG
ncbi:MAG TPA: bifunctional 2-polyprenyl-6-hydroxyphenol methylase/3-demethylubiquinol 3-O-methyltransferase UbiG [Steroidobacteraceae bacterium]|jgi:2-polyprenyl-6-hydroxyphenyl methylase/3-demethylubiquinone-9 3-methyltransferase